MRLRGGDLIRKGLDAFFSRLYYIKFIKKDTTFINLGLNHNQSEYVQPTTLSYSPNHTQMQPHSHSAQHTHSRVQHTHTRVQHTHTRALSFSLLFYLVFHINIRTFA